jgi:hypothetical protein
MATAQAAARRAVEAIERQTRERADAGLPLDGLPDLSADGERDGFYQAQLIRELAVRHVMSWTGVDLGGGPTPENIRAVMDLYPVGERFFQEFTLRQIDVFEPGLEETPVGSQQAPGWAGRIIRTPRPPRRRSSRHSVKPIRMSSSRRH